MKTLRNFSTKNVILYLFEIYYFGSKTFDPVTGKVLVYEKNFSYDYRNTINFLIFLKLGAKCTDLSGINITHYFVLVQIISTLFLGLQNFSASQIRLQDS